MSLYVIAARVWKGEHYRTRYYSHCDDGRPKVGEKINAPRFTCDEAVKVCGQLNVLAPERFIVLGEDKRPPSAWASGPPPAGPHQVDIEDITEKDTAP